MRIGIIIFLLVLITTASLLFINKEQVNDFDLACNIFTEALALNTSEKQQANYVREQLKLRAQAQDALATFNTLPMVAPGERYTLFKESAEHYTQTPWNCEMGKQLLVKLFAD